MKSKFICLDNGGETFDRYTIIERATGEMVGASEQPSNPLGFGQYCGNVADNYWRVSYGSQWRKGCDERLLNKRIKYAVYLYMVDCGNVGKVVKFESLPETVQKYAKEVFAPDYCPM